VGLADGWESVDREALDERLSLVGGHAAFEGDHTRLQAILAVPVEIRRT
jgi:hypothetical protein